MKEAARVKKEQKKEAALLADGLRRITAILEEMGCKAMIERLSVSEQEAWKQTNAAVCEEETAVPLAGDLLAHSRKRKEGDVERATDGKRRRVDMPTEALYPLERETAAEGGGRQTGGRPPQGNDEGEWGPDEEGGVGEYKEGGVGECKEGGEGEHEEREVSEHEEREVSEHEEEGVGEHKEEGDGRE